MQLHPAYLAGIVDSDGSLSITRQHWKKRPNPVYVGLFQLTWIANNQTENVLKELVSKYGGTYSRYTNNKDKFNNAKPYFKYGLQNKKLIPFLNDVLPFLKLKTRQARNILRLQLILNKPGVRGISEQQTRIKNKLYLLNKDLNYKNTVKGNKNENYR